MLRGPARQFSASTSLGRPHEQAGIPCGDPDDRLRERPGRHGLACEGVRLSRTDADADAGGRPPHPRRDGGGRRADHAGDADAGLSEPQASPRELRGGAQVVEGAVHHRRGARLRRRRRVLISRAPKRSGRDDSFGGRIRATDGKRYRAEDLEGHRWMFMEKISVEQPTPSQGRPAQRAAPAQVRGRARRRRGFQPPACEGKAHRAGAHRPPGRPQLASRRSTSSPSTAPRDSAWRTGACRATAW